MGDINVFTGPMKCGKTQKILNELDRQLIAGKNIMVFKPSIDNRFGENIVQTRSGKKLMQLILILLKNFQIMIQIYIL